MLSVYLTSNYWVLLSSALLSTELEKQCHWFYAAYILFGGVVQERQNQVK